MRRKVTILSIFIALALTAAAQSSDELISYGVEPVRPRIVPYARLADAQVGDVSLSRYAVPLSQWSEQRSDGATTYTTDFIMDVAWLNRQVLLRIGYADRALRLVVNGEEVGFSACGAYGVEFNITKRVQEGRNEISLILDDAAFTNRLYTPSSQIKGAKVGSLAAVEVLCPPTIRIRDAVCQTRLNDSGDGIVEAAIPIKCDALNRKSATMN